MIKGVVRIENENNPEDEVHAVLERAKQVCVGGGGGGGGGRAGRGAAAATVKRGEVVDG